MRPRLIVIPVLALATAAWPHETNFGLSPHTVYREGWLVEYGFHQEEASGGGVRRRSRESEMHALYGVRADLSLGLSLPWAREEEARNGPSEGASGPGDLGLLAKYRVFKFDSLLASDYVSVLGDLRLPTASRAGTPALSEGGGSILAGLGYARVRKYWSGWADAGLRLHGTDGGERPGREAVLNLALGWRPRVAEIDELDVQALLELNHEQQAGREGHAAWFLSPGVGIARGTTMLKVAVQLPLRQHWDGIQPDVDYRLRIVMEHLF